MNDTKENELSGQEKRKIKVMREILKIFSDNDFSVIEAKKLLRDMTQTVEYVKVRVKVSPESDSEKIKDSQENLVESIESLIEKARISIYDAKQIVADVSNHIRLSGMDANFKKPNFKKAE